MSEINNQRQAAALLFLHAQTSLHPGSGTALGVVDLPVQRERHTQWPLIPGSALKGILRDRCREAAMDRYQDDVEEHEGRRRVIRSKRRVANEEDALLTAAFGPGKVDEQSAHAGAISLTDARIAAFPVRSLRGVFAWVTCPAVLGRLTRDLALAGIREILVPAIAEPNQALCPTASPLVLLPEKKIILEEFEFSVAGELPATLPRWFGEHAIAPSDAFSANRLEQHLVVLSDEYFTHFVRHATEVLARIGLDYDKKAVKSGALFYQEFLPPETLFYSVILATASRRDGDSSGAAAMLEYLRQHVTDGAVLQVGGDETTVKGLGTVRISAAGGARYDPDATRHRVPTN